MRCWRKRRLPRLDRWLSSNRLLAAVIHARPCKLPLLRRGIGRVTSLILICNERGSRGLILIPRLVAIRLFAPGPIKTQVSVILSLSDGGMAVSEKQLKSRIAKFLITPAIDQCWRAALRRQGPFRPVIKDLGSQRPFLAQIALKQPSREWIIPITGHAEHRHSTAPIRGPRPKAFLRPQRDLVPRLAHSQASSSAASRNLEHRKCPDHWPMLALLNKLIFNSKLQVADAECARSIRRKNRRRRNNDVKVNVGQGAPVEFQRGPLRIGFDRRAIRRGERVELVVPEIDWLRIVGLKRR